ncbi:MAG: hypothetical protein H0T89_14090 [Deltaproteobacteria bacterium]|nr:hypothetical protein [Deltaproteobacteria bacterium]
MGVQELHALVLDATRPLAERERALNDLRGLGTRFPELAWRAAVRAPLRAALDELGLFVPTFDEDFDEAVPILDLELGKLVVWALARLRLRCVPVPKDLSACTRVAFRAALTNVTGVEPTLDVVGTLRSPIEVRVTLGPVQTSIERGDPVRDVFALLAAWAERSGTTRRPVFASNLAVWLANDVQFRAAERLGVRIERAVVRALDPLETVRAVVPGARIAPFEDHEHLDDFNDYRCALVDAACATSDRIEDVTVDGRRVTLAIDGAPVELELPRTRPRDFRELAIRIFDALAAVLEPRLGARPVLAKGDIIVLATADEYARLRDAGLLE